MASNSQDTALGLGIALAMVVSLFLGKLLGMLLLIAGYFWGAPAVWKYLCGSFEGEVRRFLLMAAAISAWTAFCCVL